jgi:hypothetical protein
VAVSLVPVPSEQHHASCPNCSAALAPDQRYCLACGQPVSPVRLAFLDVLQSEPQLYGPGQIPLGSAPPGYVTVVEPSSGVYGWMRRYSGLFGLLSVLLMAIIVGLLVGHWITQSKAPSQQVIKLEGSLTGGTPLAAAASTSPASTAPTSTTPASTAPQAAAASAKAEAAEVKEAKAIEKAPLPKPVKITSAKLEKISSTTGKKHEEEVNNLRDQPVESK